VHRRPFLRPTRPQFSTIEISSIAYGTVFSGASLIAEAGAQMRRTNPITEVPPTLSLIDAAGEN
jgi:hypothetical protein